MRCWIGFCLTLALAGAASGATVTVVVAPFPDPGSGHTITITTTLTTDGTEEPAQLALLELLWDDSKVSGVPGPVQNDGGLTSFGGSLPWLAGVGTCLSASCLIIDFLSPILGGAAPDAGTVTTTLELVLGSSPGLLFLSFGTTDVFGATPQLFIVPEPSTGALVGLGLGVLASARRRRSRAAPAALDY